MNRLNRKIPQSVLYDNIDFFNSYRIKYLGVQGTVYVCDATNKDEILAYGNTVLLIVSPQYAPEIKHRSVFVTDSLIRPDQDIYDVFKKCRMHKKS